MKKHSEDLPLPNWIEAEDFEFICFNLAKELMSFDEPIPDYSTRDISLLESSLSAPKNTFYNSENLTLSDLATSLFYSLVKNHPFVNGNKRIALMSVLVFLRLNNKWLDVPQKLLYQLAVEVANSLPENRTQTINHVRNILDDYLIDYSEFEERMKNVHDEF